jgi:hypothetical protein
MAMTSNASTADSISTVYKNGEFVSYCRVWVNASDNKCESVTNDFANQMCYNLDALFSWGLKGMNLRKEKKELMMFYFKSTSFNKRTNILQSVGDVIVPGVITVSDIKISTLLTTRKYSNGKNTSTMDLVSSNGLVKKTNTSFSMIPQKEKGTWFVLETRTQFGWFFNIFITQNRYKTIMEWRLRRYVHNLKDEAEKREKNQ